MDSGFGHDHQENPYRDPILEKNPDPNPLLLGHTVFKKNVKYIILLMAKIDSALAVVP